MYMVKAKNVTSYILESEVMQSYGKALDYALECKDSNQYSVITILRADADGINENKFFLYRIIK